MTIMDYRRQRFAIAIKVIALTLGTAKPLYPTAIAIYFGHDWAVISTDGAGMRASKDQPPIPGCKITCIKNLCFTAAGSYGSLPSLPWNVFDEADMLMGRSQDIEEVVRGFAVDTPPVLKKLIEIVKITRPDRYQMWLEGRPVLQAVFASVTATGAKGFQFVYLTDSKGVLQPTKPNPIVVPEGMYAEVFLGHADQMAGFATNNIPLINDTVTRGRVPMVRLTEKLVQIEIDAAIKERRPEVGPPIATVWMLPDGIRVQTMGACQK
jgi:hypothetical protein